MLVFVYCDCLLVCIVLILLNIDIEYEWFLRKATKKIPIKNKYTSEAQDGDKVSEYIGKQFEEQVIHRIDN